MSILDDLPPTSDKAQLVIVPGLLSGLGITRRTVPAWITDPGLIDDILSGHADIPADLGGDQ